MTALYGPLRIRCDVCGTLEPESRIRVLDSVAGTWQCVACIRKTKVRMELENIR